MPSITSTIAMMLICMCSCQPKQQSRESLTDPPPNRPELNEEWITIDYVMGRFDPATHTDFVLIDTSDADRSGLYLRKDAYAAFRQMSDAAAAQGHKMIIRSATRNFDYQKGIWERKWKGETTLEGGMKASDISDPVLRAKKILLYSSMPGTSRHHWGTDIDINSFNNDYFKSGQGGALYRWMQENASSYGFCQPYTDKSNGRTGYEEERWHWSFKTISDPLTQYCKLNLKNEMITGFEGSETAVEVNMMDNYVLGIDHQCRN